MAKVIRVFRERMHDMERYEIGDEYPEKDSERVEYLTRAGFLEPSERPKRRKKDVNDNADSDG